MTSAEVVFQKRTQIIYFQKLTGSESLLSLCRSQRTGVFLGTPAWKGNAMPRCEMTPLLRRMFEQQNEDAARKATPHVRRCAECQAEVKKLMAEGVGKYNFWKEMGRNLLVGGMAMFLMGGFNGRQK